MPGSTVSVDVAQGCSGAGVAPAGTGAAVGLPGLAWSVLACWVAICSGESVGGSESSVAGADRPVVWPAAPVVAVCAQGIAVGVTGVTADWSPSIGVGADVALAPSVTVDGWVGASSVAVPDAVLDCSGPPHPATQAVTRQRQAIAVRLWLTVYSFDNARMMRSHVALTIHLGRQPVTSESMCVREVKDKTPVIAKRFRRVVIRGRGHLHPPAPVSCNSVASRSICPT